MAPLTTSHLPTAALVAAVALVLAPLTACKKSPPPDEAAPAPAGQETVEPRTEASAEGAARAERDQRASTLCRDGLHRALGEVEKMHTSRRLAPVLAAVGERCQDALGPLAIAAQTASESGMPRRAVQLAAAAAPLLPPTCVAEDPAGPALEPSHACPPPESFALAEPLLQHLDAGTYLFALALREQLGKRGVLDERVDQLLSNLVLAGALEGEVRGQK